MAALPKVGPGSSKIEIGFYLPSLSSAEAEIADVLKDVMIDAFDNLVKNFQDIIIDPLVLGGKGWKPLVNTAAWKWLNSPRAFGQLGFTNALTPLRLLNVLRQSWTAKMIRSGTKQNIKIGIQFNWANLEQIYRATEHPAAGKLGLPAGRSWFEWLYAGAPLREEGYKFKKTGPSPGVRSSSIAGAEAGRMVKGGFWEVSPRFRVDLDKLWFRNEARISKTIEDYISNHISTGVK